MRTSNRLHYPSVFPSEQIHTLNACKLTTAMAHNSNNASPTVGRHRSLMEPYSPQHPSDIDTTDATLDLTTNDDDDVDGAAAATTTSGSLLDFDDDNDEDRAPSDFNVPSTPDGFDWSADGCVMRCHLCTSSRRSFHCRDCVERGDFLHAHSGRLGERFFEKRARLNALQQRKDALADRASALLLPFRERETLRQLLEQKRREAVAMRAELERRRALLEHEQQLHKQLTDSLADAKKKFPGFANNVDNLRSFVEERLKRNEQLTVERDAMKRQLTLRVRRLIGCLTTYVFPIREVRGSGPDALRQEDGARAAANTRTASVAAAAATASAARSSSSSTTSLSKSDAAAHEEKISALAEATRTAYVGGRWVLQASAQHELQHAVVAPTLPANGDYSAYVDWIETTNQDGGPPGTPNQAATAAAMAATPTAGRDGDGTLTSLNDAYRISAALTYATQMVNLLSYYLDVHLPYRLSYA